MQTFVPFTDTWHTARTLDRQRLGKQRIECQQILQTLAGESHGWAKHPAVRMWRGHERYLATYTVVMIREWLGRGYHDTRLPVIRELANHFPASAMDAPPWWGDLRIHDSHLASLLRKNREHYQAAVRLSDVTVERLLDIYPGYVWPTELVEYAS